MGMRRASNFGYIPVAAGAECLLVAVGQSVDLSRQRDAQFGQTRWDSQWNDQLGVLIKLEIVNLFGGGQTLQILSLDSNGDLVQRIGIDRRATHQQSRPNQQLRRGTALQLGPIQMFDPLGHRALAPAFPSRNRGLFLLY